MWIFQTSSMFCSSDHFDLGYVFSSLIEQPHHAPRVKWVLCPEEDLVESSSSLSVPDNTFCKSYITSCLRVIRVSICESYMYLCFESVSNMIDILALHARTLLRTAHATTAVTTMMWSGKKSKRFIAKRTTRGVLLPFGS